MTRVIPVGITWSQLRNFVLYQRRVERMPADTLAGLLGVSESRIYEIEAGRKPDMRASTRARITQTLVSTWPGGIIPQLVPTVQDGGSVDELVGPTSVVGDTGTEAEGIRSFDDLVEGSDVEPREYTLERANEELTAENSRLRAEVDRLRRMVMSTDRLQANARVEISGLKAKMAMYHEMAWAVFRAMEDAGCLEGRLDTSPTEVDDVWE